MKWCPYVMFSGSPTIQFSLNSGTASVLTLKTHAWKWTYTITPTADCNVQFFPYRMWGGSDLLYQGDEKMHPNAVFDTYDSTNYITGNHAYVNWKPLPYVGTTRCLSLYSGDRLCYGIPGDLVEQVRTYHNSGWDYYLHE